MALASGVFSGINIIGPGQTLSAYPEIGNGSFIIRTTPADIAVNNILVINGTLSINGSIVGFALQSAPISEATTLSTSQSGTWFAIDQSTAPYTITLPDPADGLNFKFFLATAGTMDITLSSAALVGKIIDTDTGYSVKSVTGTLIFAGGIAKVGDNIEVYGVGTTWFFKATTGASGGIS